MTEYVTKQTTLMQNGDSLQFYKYTKLQVVNTAYSVLVDWCAGATDSVTECLGFNVPLDTY